VSDDHQIPWGMPGPTDPAERANATMLRMGDDPISLGPRPCTDDGVPDLEQQHADAQQSLREGQGA
jgi:hypothetical protein